MNEKIISHAIRYPHARTSTIRYLVRREEMNQRLRAEIAMNSRPKSKTTVRAMMLGVAALMAKMGGAS